MTSTRRLLAPMLACAALGCSGASPDACSGETDAELCAQQLLVCGSGVSTDRCGVSRDVVCGACDGTCHGTLCRCESSSFTGQPTATGGSPGSDTVINDAPADGSGYTCLSTPSLPESECVSVPGRQHVLLGTTPTASTILLARGAACVSGRLWIYDGDFTSGVYAGVDIQALFAGFTPALSLAEDQLTLTPDALTVIATLADRSGFVASTRSAVGSTDFAAPTTVWFANVNDAAAVLGNPSVSNDGLSFFFVRNGVLMEARRSSAGAAFGTPVALAGTATDEINDGTFSEVTGATADRLTLYVTKSWSTFVFVRDDLDAKPANLNIGGASSGIWRAQPIQACGRLLGTITAGGCAGESIGWFVAN